MATTGTTGVRTPSVEAILNALRQHPDATAAKLAEAAGIGRSTAAKTLATLEAEGRVVRQRGTPRGGKAAPDHWTLAPDPRSNHSDPDPAEPPAARTVITTQRADTTKIPAEPPSAEAVPVAGTAAPSGTEATVKGLPKTARSSAAPMQPPWPRPGPAGWSPPSAPCPSTLRVGLPGSRWQSPWTATAAVGLDGPRASTASRPQGRAGRRRWGGRPAWPGWAGGCAARAGAAR